MSDSPILQAALAYATKGWPVFPCRADTKAPLIKAWQRNASTDAAQIRNWWGSWPAAMIGLPLGGATGLFALDFDPRQEIDGETGEVTQFTYAQLKAETEAMIGGELPPTAASRTPSGGFHIFYRQPADSGGEIRNRGNLPAHVDVRGQGGYVIAPPSVRADGAAYRWVERRDPQACPPAEAPAALIELLRAGKSAPAGPARELTESGNGANGIWVAGAAKGLSASEAVRRYGLSALDAEAEALRRMGRGGRNKALNIAAVKLGSLVAAGALSEGVVRAALLDACHGNGLAGEDGARACEATIDSGLKHGRENPRDLRDIEAEAERRAGRVGGPARRPAAEGRATGGAAGRTSAPPAPAASSDEGAASAARPPAPSDWSDEFRPSHMGVVRKRGRLWGPRGEDGRRRWDWQWAREIADVARQLRCIGFPLTDLGNAERFAARHGWRFRYTEMRGWFCWDGRRWVREGAEAALLKAAQDTVRAIQWEAKFIAESGVQVPSGVRFQDDGDLSAVGRALEFEGRRMDDPDAPGLDEFIEYKNGRTRCRSDRHSSWGRASEAAGKIAAIPQLLKGLPGITVKTDVFDRHPMVFNVLNGALHFERGPDGPRLVKRRHDPELLLTKLAAVIYDPRADCPVYDAFLGRVQPDPEIRRFLHAWAGYNLTGDVGQQCFVILHGAKGANGKSTWEKLRSDLMGDYSLSVKIETFLNSDKKGSGTEASPDIARLPGARHVQTSEPGQQAAFAEDLIKVVTGSERMVARQLHKEFFEFDPQFKITVQCNREPKASDDPAFWRRVKKVPFDVSIPEPERDELLGQKMLAEASGILNHFIAGALDWMAGGLPTVERIVQATAAYRERSDTLGSFLRAATRPEEGATVGSHELYTVYCAWCVFAGEKAWTQKGFSNALNGAGFEKVKASSMRWQGLRLTRDADAFVIRDHVGDGKFHERPREEMGPEIEGLPAVAEGGSAAREGDVPNPPAGAVPPELDEKDWPDAW
jgi:putative DNA primase/helicase